jgi:molecular chaperone HscC
MPIIGIDLGTTNSLVAVFENGAPKLIPNAHGEHLTPSVVGLLDDGRIIVGEAAKELRVTQPDNCASCFKRWIGTDRTTKIGDREFNATELSSLILHSLKADAESYLGQQVIEATITVPAYFNENQRKATKLAGEMIGLKVRRIINEPTAAALTYGFHDRDAEKHLMVIDLGGGTFDVTLMEISQGTLEIIATAGESQLGGEDFTNRLMAAVYQRESLHLETAEMKFPLRTARLRKECENAKRELAEKESTRIRIPNNDGNFDDQSALQVNRETFAKICKPLVQRIVSPISKVLRDGEQAPEAIDDIILVGGSTRMTLMTELVQEYFGKPAQMKFNPDEVVALGAAVQAALIEDNKAVDDMVLTDVCPFTLGVEVVKQFGGQIADGYFQPVINRNTTIPVSREEVFNTVVANQPEVLLRVYQGEARKVKDNLLLGELKIDNIPPGPAGHPVQVRFTYDINGLLEVEAIIAETQQRFSLVLTQHCASLSDQDIRRAIENLKNVKFYPRDELKNQRLIHFCESMVGEVSPFHRQELEESIDIFETAMSSGNRDRFETSREGLMLTLSRLGIEYHENLD